MTMTTSSHPSIQKKSSDLNKIQKTWSIKIHNPLAQQAFSIQFSILSSKNGFKKIAEIFVLFFQKNKNHTIKKLGIKQTYPLHSFHPTDENQPSLQLAIANNILRSDETQGAVQANTHQIHWNLQFSSKENPLHPTHMYAQYQLLTSGTLTINGESILLEQAPGMRGYFNHTKKRHSWIWSHCNAFLDETGTPSSLLFEGLRSKLQLGPLLGPALSSFYFFYRNQPYLFNTWKDSFFVQSKDDLNTWQFRLDRGALSFRGMIRAESNEFIGVSREDIYGSILYSSSSEMAHATLHVYRNGKLEASFVAPGTASFEMVSREKNPYLLVNI
jgi:hypothetical protein